MNKLFEVTWVANGSKCVNVEFVEANTRMEAQGKIRWREVNNSGVKEITAKQVEVAA